MVVKNNLLRRLYSWFPLVYEGGFKSEPPGRFGEQNRPLPDNKLQIFYPAHP